MTIWIGIEEKKWKPFFKYMVSEDGDIIGRKPIKPFKDKDGYLRVALHYKGCLLYTSDAADDIL
jgi:hypothetical protein